MPIDVQRFSEYRPVDSITIVGNTSVAKDYQQPFSFSSWLASFRQYNETPQIYLDLYRNYLSDWYIVKNKTILTNEQLIVLSYISIFYDLKLTYFTTDEKRFLTTLDYNNKEDIDIAIPFFARKIKQICVDLSNLRETVKAQPVRLNLGGTSESISKLLFESLITSYADTDLQPMFNKQGIDQQYILDNTKISIEELYDDTNYYTLSGYNEVLSITQNLFLDINSSILEQLSSVDYIIPELSESLLIVPPLSTSDLQSLYNNDFINTINDGLSSNLNLNNTAQLILGFTGSNYYYLSTNSNTDVVSGSLFNASSISNNDQNIFNLKFAIKQIIGDNLYSAKDVGGFYLPERIGVLNYNPIKSTYTVNNSNLQPNQVYIFPDPSVYPYGSGALVFAYQTSTYKYSFNDQYIYGDIKNDGKLPDFKGYQSLNSSLDQDFQNISKPTDSVGFFKDSSVNIWLNPDVYNNKSDAIFPTVPRQNSLLVDNSSDLIKFQTDVFGNSYGLFKTVYKQQNRQVQTVDTFTCIELDGYDYVYPRYSSIEFNYSLSGDIDGATRTGLSANTYNQLSAVNGSLFGGLTSIPEFTLSSFAYYTFGGSFVDLNCTDIQSTTYNGTTEFDGYTFVNDSNGAILYDLPQSDSPLWPEGDNGVNNLFYLYYQLLLEGGQDNSGNQPTYTDPGTFTPASLSSVNYTITDTNQIKDAGYFVYTAFDGISAYNYNPFAPKANDYFTRDIPSYTDVLSTNLSQYTSVSGLSSNVDIYKKRNIVTGDWYVRSGNNTIIAPVSSALSANFNRYPDAVKNELNNSVLNFDIVYDTLIIETPNYQVIEKIIYDFDNGIFISSYVPIIYISRGSQYSLEKFGNFWFNEFYKNVLLFKTTLYPSVSSGFNKVIYPEVYKFDLSNYGFKRIYPQGDTDLTRFSMVSYLSSYFSLQTPASGLNYIFNPENYDKPVVTYNQVPDVYNVSIKVYDNAGAYGFIEMSFKFIDGVFTLLSNKMYFANQLIRDESYSNPITATYLDYTIPVAGLTIGQWVSADGVYKF